MISDLNILPLPVLDSRKYYQFTLSSREDVTMGAIRAPATTSSDRERRRRGVRLGRT